MVRVFEPHPGGHGWHVHGIVAGYWPVQIVRPLAKMAGFGRIHVQPARSGCEVYLAKYLRKVLDFVGRLKGTRVWATIGGKVGGVEEGWRCRVAGVQVDSPGSRAWRDWFKRRLGDGFMIPGNERSGFAEALFAAKHFWLGDGSWLSTAAPF